MNTVATLIDHTLLRPEATHDQIVVLCREAVEHGFASVCVNSCWVPLVAAELAGTRFAQALQLALEYAPAPPFDCGRPETAPPEILAEVRSRMAAIMPKRLAEAQAAAARLASSP